MVNTFLPFADFKKTAECLDYRRLGKGRIEARQIIQVIENTEAKGWKNHPAVSMWRGYTDALKLYFNVIVTEWIKRGYKNNLPFYVIPSDVTMPWWMGNDKFHGSHRASLRRKNIEYYGDLLEDEEEYRDKGYVWPKTIMAPQVKVVKTADGQAKLIPGPSKIKRLLQFAEIKTA